MDLGLFRPERFEDERGWFIESYNKQIYEDKGINVEFIQDNHSYSKNKGTLRGIHFQNDPKAQSKLVRCTRGSILDVAIDLRKGSDTYKKCWTYVLSAENRKQLFIPKGFGHGFVTLEDETEVQYKVDEFYSKEHDRSIRYDDPELAIPWEGEAFILSDKDIIAPFLKDSDVNFAVTVLVTGAKGQLGSDVLKSLEEYGLNCIGVDIEDFDITNYQETLVYIESIYPDIIIHCAAYTAVDKAEVEKDICEKVNVLGTKNVAKACSHVNAKMVYLSTDYVFDGQGDSPHKESETTAPLNYYGSTKALGEAVVRENVSRHFIIRTSWVFGKNGKNFVNTMLRLAKGKKELRVVNDQIGSPTYTVDLARTITEMIQTKHFGTYHITNEGSCSWAEFARKIFSLRELPISVIPIPTREYPTKAQRPLNSLLSKDNLDKNDFLRLPNWEDALERYLDDINGEVKI